MHSKTDSLDEWFEQLRQHGEREDIVMLINACFAATRQNEYYTTAGEQSVSIDFLHQYVLANYRSVYAKALAVGINHFNQACIIVNLLSAGAPTNKQQRIIEGKLIATSLRTLPANRVFAIFQTLQRKKVNNRRTRAIVRDYLKHRPDPAFDAIKYRSKYRAASVHCHIPLHDEFGKFLFHFKSQRNFQTKLFDQFRAGHYSEQAIYDLPFTIAQGLATKHDVPQDKFLKKIEPKMTRSEKLRFQTAAKRSGVATSIDLRNTPLTRLAIYILSLPLTERRNRFAELDRAMSGAAQHASNRFRFSLNRVAAVLDGSLSSIGSRQKRNRPLAVALATSYLLRQTANEFRPFWTCPQMRDPVELFVEPCGQTSLAQPVLDALQWKPDLLLIISDGFENDPPQATGDIVRVFRQKIDREQTTQVLHVNPVFDSNHFAPKPISDQITTVGVRDAEDLPTMIGFAKFAGGAPLAELEGFLNQRVDQMLGEKQR